jgi:GNAT superfamily N-acetyltransferase
MKDRVYSETLWVFIVEEQTNKEVAFGISQYDELVHELILDWIQVLPAYRKKGLGRMLVNYMLNSAPKKTKFATVSGNSDDISSPEKLYRTCGFTGNDLWHILRK